MDYNAAVRFNVGFVYHIQPQLVAELIELRRIRVVRRPDGVYIVAFHLREVEPHFVQRRVVPGVWVHALEFYRGSVQLNNAIFNAYPAESHTLADDLAARVYSQAVEVRRFGIPELRVGYFHGNSFAVCRRKVRNQPESSWRVHSAGLPEGVNTSFAEVRSSESSVLMM